MNKVEKIKAEIERLKNELIQEAEKGNKLEFDEGRISAFEDMITFINSLEELVSNDLEEAAYQFGCCFENFGLASASFIKGAQWQKEQMMKNSDFINEVEWEDDVHKLFREKGKKVKLMIVEEE